MAKTPPTWGTKAASPPTSLKAMRPSRPGALAREIGRRRALGAFVAGKCAHLNPCLHYCCSAHLQHSKYLTDEFRADIFSAFHRTALSFCPGGFD